MSQVINDENRIDAGTRLAGQYQRTDPPRTPDLLGWMRWGEEYAMQRYIRQLDHDPAARIMERQLAAGLGVSDPWPDPPAPPPTPGRTGLVHLVDRCFVDDGGPWNPLGTSCFWAVWGAQHDNARLVQNVDWVHRRRVDVLRVFAEISHAPTWADRDVDPDAPEWADAIAGTMEIAQRQGVRIAWTLFAGDRTWMALDGTKRERTRDWYIQVTRQWCLIAKSFPATVQYVVIRNEMYGPTDTEVRELASIVRAQTPFAVALAAFPQTGTYDDFYRSSAATMGTEHVDRDDKERGYRQVRQPWGYLGRSNVPMKFISDEPPGIDSSSGAVSDPEKLAAAAITTVISGGMYVLHNGAGTRGGGIADLTRGRKANYWEQPTMEPALALIAQAHGLLAPDFSNWARHGHLWATHPFKMVTLVGDDIEYTAAFGTNRQYAATQGGQAICLFAGIKGRVVVRPVRDYVLACLSLSSGKTWPADWRAGQEAGFTQSDGASVLVVSR